MSFKIFHGSTEEEEEEYLAQAEEVRVSLASNIGTSPVAHLAIIKDYVHQYCTS